MIKWNDTHVFMFPYYKDTHVKKWNDKKNLVKRQ